MTVRGKTGDERSPVSGEDILSEILRNMELGLFRIRYTALVPSVYRVYLQSEDYEPLRNAIPFLVEEIKRALAERLEEMKKAERAPAILKRLGASAKDETEYKILGTEWTVEILPDVEGKLEPGEIEVYSELAPEPKPEYGSGSMTRRITRKQEPETVRQDSAVQRDESPALAQLHYEDNSGPHDFAIRKNQVVIGRGGRSYWVDVQVDTVPDVSREHCRLRRDAGSGTFYLKDLSQFGTTLDGKPVASSIERSAGEVRDRNIEVPVPRRARIGLAGSCSWISNRFPRHDARCSGLAFRTFSCSWRLPARICMSMGSKAGASMAVSTRIQAAAASHPGQRRGNNEDRFLCDPERGIFLVIDGMGGQAAGEKAAEIALSVMKARLERQTGTAEDRVREAITLANNEILQAAEKNPEWRGMACVLTAAIVEDRRALIGHVGDSRLYLLRPGEIRKITHDHSPVGEREDRRRSFRNRCDGASAAQRGLSRCRFGCPPARRPGVY